LALLSLSCLSLPAVQPKVLSPRANTARARLNTGASII
jgi:hypothetical protein